MSREQIIKAWKDEEYRLGLSEAERSALPDNPAGIVELPDPDMDTVAGGLTELIWTAGCCNDLFTLLCGINTTTIKGLIGCFGG
jgi:mersacidin/lichenicidin family type 2 lantibiotic